VRGTHTSQAAGNNLASLGDKLLQQAYVAVVDRIDLLHAELADLLAPEELASTTWSARTTWSTSTWAAATGTITRWTVWAIPCGTVWTISRRTLWTITGRTLGCGALRRARCCCYCAGLISHGFLLLSSRPAFSYQVGGIGPALCFFAQTGPAALCAGARPALFSKERGGA
jgi:hypothetical protein